MDIDQVQLVSGYIRRSLRRYALRILSGCLIALAACGGEPGVGTTQEEAERLVDDLVIDPATGTAEVEGESEGEEVPSTFYYDLTTFDWYRRGQPLLVGGRPYQAVAVETTGERKMVRDGSYEGVDYYRAADAAQPPDSVFVPVYPGYWLPFVDLQPKGQ